MGERITHTGNKTTMVVSYVDDAVICVSARDKRKLEGIAREVWEDQIQEAGKIA